MFIDIWDVFGYLGVWKCWRTCVEETDKVCSDSTLLSSCVWRIIKEQRIILILGQEV